MFFDLEILKHLRKKHHYTQEYLAHKAGLNKSYISRLENDTRDVSPTLETIGKIGAAFNMCPSLLIPCNCRNCTIRKTEIEKLMCKREVLNMYTKFVQVSGNLVDYEIKNIDKLDKNNLSFGDAKFIRENKIM